MAESTMMRSFLSMLLLCMLVQGIRAEFYSRPFFNFTMSGELYDVDDIKFQMDSEYDGHLHVKYRFYNQDGSVDYQGQGVLFQGDRNREWNMGKLPFNYRKGGEQFDLYGFDLISGEARFNFSLNEFMYFESRDKIEFECSGIYRSNEDITFNLTNNLNETMYYNYTFSSEDDQLDNFGRGQFFAGDAMRENMGQIPRNWAYSRNFTLSLDVYDEEGEWRYGRTFNNFTYNDQAYDFQMSNNFNFDDEYVTFDFTNFMDDSVDVEWAFQAENGTRMFEQEWNFKSGEHRQVTVSRLLDFWKYGQDWFFNIVGQFQNSDMQFSDMVQDFKTDDNNDESGREWGFNMPKHIRNGQDVKFSVTNRMPSSNMDVIYYLSSDNDQYNRAGQQEISQSTQVTFSMEGISNYDKMDNFRFWIAGYNQDTREQMFSRMYQDFKFDKSRYNFKFPNTYQLGGQFNFTLENNNFELPVTKFEFLFGSSDGVVERHGEFEMKSGESNEWEVYRFPLNWDEHAGRNFSFSLRGSNPDTDEEIYRKDFDNMMFFGDQDKNNNDDDNQDNRDNQDNQEDTFKMSQRVNSGEGVSFSFTNTMNDVMYLYYSFFSDDGFVSFRGNEMVNQGETLEQNMGMIPRDYENSTDFRFEMRGFREDEQVFEIVRDNFKYGNRSYMFDMPTTIFANKNITFTMENMMENDRMAYNWRFYSDDGEFEFQGHSKLWAGHNKVNNVGKIPRNYNGSRNFQFEITGINDNNDEELFSETMSNFFFETGTYTIFMPQVVRPGFDITFSMTSTRRSESMIILYDFHSDDMEVQFVGDAEIRRGESSNFVVGTIPRGYQGSQNFRFNISGLDRETSEIIFQEETENFRFERKSVSMLMESNQDMYRPGETMRFRCVCLSPDLLPMQGNIEYFFEGPNGEVFRQNRTRLQQGVVDGEMPLHENCQNGEWQVRVVYKQQEEVMKFRVTSEKRQSFNVNVWAAEYYYDEIDGLNVKFEANYRQGHGVQGKARLRAEIKAPFKSYTEHNKQSNVFRQSFDNFDQNDMFFISKDTLRKLGWQSWTDLILEVSVSVTDRYSKETYEDMAVVELKRTNIKLDVQHRPQTIKPGMSYIAHIKVSEQDDKPLRSEDRSRNDLIVDVEYRYPIRGLADNFVFSKNWADSLIYTPPKTERFVMKIPENGEVKFNMNVYDDEFEYVSFRCYTNTTSKLYGLSKTSQWIVKPTESPSRSFIQCRSDKNQYAVGERIHFNVQFSEEINRFSIMVLSRGMIMMQRKYQLKEASREFDAGFDTTFQMAPGIKVFVTYVRSDGELVADYFSVALVENLVHEVDMSVSAEYFGFNQDMAVNVQTGSSDSYVGVAVRNSDYDDNKRSDRFERRERFEREITQERVIEDMQTYSYSSKDQEDDQDDRSREEPWWQWRWTRPSGAMSTNAAFDDVNMNVMTDAKMQDWDRDAYQQQRRQRNSNERMRRSRKSQQNFNDQSWMWMNRRSDDDGSVRFNASTPRMMSSYSVRAFMVSHNGFGVSADKNFKVYEKLFLNIDAPREVTKDEVMIVQSTVYNYNKQDLAVNMVMEDSDQFELLMIGEDPTMSGPVRWLTVPAGGSVRVDYPVRMDTLGDVELNVQVRSNRGEASHSRNVQVQPQGNRQCYTYSVNINRRNNSYSQRPSSLDTFKVEFPDNAVEGSQQAELNLYTDIMRSTMEYFGDLIQQPSGNGEQNMVDFSPASYLYHYMKYHQYRGEPWTERPLRKFRDFMATAYQNQQNYKHMDGSYSMFGEKDEFGSTWLTAYVYKIYKSMFNSFPFNQGQRNETRETMDFLLKQQNEDGSFRERGNFFNQRMQSDNETNSRVALTAFVTIAMMEGGSRENFKVENKYRFAEAGQYLESQLENIKDDQYTLSLVTYALNMMNVSTAQQAMDYFENFRYSNGEKDMMYWSMPDSYRSQYHDDVNAPYAHPSAACVEMTSYALLSYVKRQEWEKARQVMNWLVAHRNNMGGFRNSYSTAIAVQALTQWRMEQEQNYRYSQNMEVRMSHSEDSQFNNKTVMDAYKHFYTIDVPAMNGNVELLTSGQGMMFAQLSVCYNLMETPYKQETFDCQKSTYSPEMDSGGVQYCCRLQRNDMNKTGLFFFQIELPNGFSVDVREVRKKNQLARWMNFDETSFNVYYDQLEPGQEVCAIAMMYRTDRVASNKRAYMSAQDYYNPGRRNVQWYTIDRFQDSTACNVCGIRCSGCPEPRLSEWRETVPCMSCDQKFSTWRRECVDPSLNMNLDASECYEDEQEERRACNVAEYFPICPDSHDGLWRVMPNYSDKDLNAEDDSQMCNLRPAYLSDYAASEYDNAAKNGVPGTNLEFYKAYLECDMDQSSFVDAGDFSLSMMVNVQSFKKRGKGVIFAYGDENKPAVFKLWHHSMYGSPIVFRVSLNNFIYTVGPIDGRNLIQKWTHIMVTWNKEETSFYINGTSVGWSFHFPSKKQQNKPQNPKLFIGRDTQNNNGDTLNGWVSSLDFWSRTLDKEDARNLYNFYRRLVEASRNDNDDAEIPSDALRYMAPDAYKQCFKRSSSIMDLFRRETCREEY